MPEKALMSRPEIWIDGRLENLKIIYPTTNASKNHIIGFSCAQLDETELRNLGLQKIQDLIQLVRADKDCKPPLYEDISEFVEGEVYGRAHLPDPNLITRWSHLRRYLWRDWRDCIID
jgi:hypothetical protein